MGTLSRHGGANIQDFFSGSGNLSFSGSDAILSGASIGSISNSSGTFTLTFNNNATQSLVDQALFLIAYSNSSSTPHASVQIDWTFNDGNSSGQGTGGALTTIGTLAADILSSAQAQPIRTISSYITRQLVRCSIMRMAMELSLSYKLLYLQVD